MLDCARIDLSWWEGHMSAHFEGPGSWCSLLHLCPLAGHRRTSNSSQDMPQGQGGRCFSQTPAQYPPPWQLPCWVLPRDPH